MKTHRATFRSALTILVTALATYETLGYQRHATPSPAIASGATTEDARIHKPVDHVDFQHVSLVDALQWVADISGLKLSVDWSTLPAEFLDPYGIPIDLHLKHVDFATVLDGVLFSIDRHHDAEWTAKDGIIIIEPREALDYAQSKDTVTRVYDIHSFIVKATHAPGINCINGLNQNQGQAQTGYSTNLSPISSYGPWTDDQNAADEICRFITDNVDTTGWIDNGGDVGSIYNAGGFLTITQTPRTQQQIERLLHLLNGEP